MTRGRLVVLLCATAGLSVARPHLARAATCAPPPQGQAKLAEVDGRDRLRWIDLRLTREAARARTWKWAWVIGIGTAGVASLVPVPFVAAGDRVDWYTSAATAAFGVVPLLLSPLSVTGDAPKLRAAIAAAPHDAGDDRVCALLADAEQKLVLDAANEKRQQGWWFHAGNLVFNTGVMLFLGLGYHHWSSGIINGVSGAVVGEALILTQPTATIEDLAAYNRGELPTTGGSWEGGGTSGGPTADR